MQNLPPLWAQWYPAVHPFVDWLTLHWDQPGLPDFTGEIWQKVDPSTGEIRSERKLSKQVERFFGSRRVSVQVSVRDGHVRIDGNPCKFDFKTNGLFSHFGPWQLSLPHGIAQGLVRAVAEETGIPFEWTPSVRVTRIDLTKHMPIPRTSDDMQQDQADVLRWLGLVSSHRGRAATASSGRESVGTVYLKASSRLWGLKVYSKGDEVRDWVVEDLVREIGETEEGEPIYEEPIYNDVMDPWFWGTARIELTLRSKELVKLPEVFGFLDSDPQAPHCIFDLDASKLDELWRIYWRRIRMPVSDPTKRDQILQTLPRNLRGVYARWKAGEDFSSTVSRMTFWRYRKKLMEHGINIDQLPTAETEKPGQILGSWAAQVGQLPGGASISGFDPKQVSMF